MSRRSLFKYPRPHRRGFARWIPSLRLVLLVVLGIALIGGITFIVGYVTTDIPPANAAAREQTTIVYYADGKTELGRFSDIDRQSVSIGGISKPMQHAAVSAEDQSFYENRGISVKGLGRAVVGVVSGNYAGGGSTITQQYVKNFYLNDKHTFSRKLNEMFIALKIDQQQSKDEILAHYLNTIYLGRGNYGVETAAQDYFHKPASQLNVPQSAMLAAMIQRPGAADPAKDPSVYKSRFNYVLDNMVNEGYLTQAQRDKVKFPKVEKPVHKQSQYKGTKGYLLDYVRRELNAHANISHDQLRRGGYRIVTTFHQKAMKAAVDAVNALPDYQPSGTTVGLTSINPKNGSVVAMYGGKNYLERQVNAATADRVQAGSTFKAFTLVAALQSGVRLDDYYNGNNGVYVKGFPNGVHNDSHENYGTISVLGATAHSVNTVYAAINSQIGPQHTMDTAIKAGLPKDTAGLSANPANVLGTSSPHNIDMANAYATFADNGVRHNAHVVKSVTSPNGNSIYKPDVSGKKVFQPDIMSETTYALEQVIDDGTGTVAQGLNRPAAGKTGTTDGNKSAWFVGYTPQMTTAVSMFRVGPHGSELPLEGFGGYSSIYGGSYPTVVWTDYMKKALAGEPVEQFPARKGLPDKTPPGGHQTTTYSPPPTSESTQEEPSESPSSPPTSDSPTSPPTSESPTSPPTSEPPPTHTEEPPPTDTESPKPPPSTTDDGAGSTSDSTAGSGGKETDKGSKPSDNQQKVKQAPAGESGGSGGGSATPYARTDPER